MSSPALETWLARLYTDAALRERFLRQPEQVARQAGLSPDEVQAMCEIDRDGLRMAAHSFAQKRAHHAAHAAHADRARKPHWLRRLWQALRSR